MLTFGYCNRRFDVPVRSVGNDLKSFDLKS